MSTEAAARAEEKAFGFWLYLMSDAVIFALLFATYAVMLDGTAGGPTGKDVFDIRHAFAETLLLLFSSLTFGFAMLARGRAGVLAWMTVTVWLAIAFVAMEVMEFVGMIEIGAGPQRSGFLSAFFTLVGTHGLHVSLGIVCALVMMGQVAVTGLTDGVRSRLARLALFWHFLDIVWIGIFSVVYLPGVM